MAQIEVIPTLFALLQRFNATPEGLSTPEIAEEFAISRQTAHKYINLLIAAGIPLYDSERRWYLEEHYRVPQYWSPSETEVLTMLLQRVAQTQMGHLGAVNTIVRKLAPILDVETDSVNAPASRDRQSIFDALVRAKQRRLAVDVVYSAFRSTTPNRWRIQPYRFVMPVWSDSFYIMCNGTRLGTSTQIRLSLKFDRILEARVTDAMFATSSGLDISSTPETLWQIWGSSSQTVAVQLRFTSRVYPRLIESQWHMTQHIIREADGSALWEAQISDVREIVPWIRGWGSDVEVLSPDTLRRIIATDLENALRRYRTQPHTSSQSPEMFWAKYDPVSQAFHLLICHLLDTAAVALAIWERMPPAQRQWLCNRNQCDESLTGRLLALVAGLHDIGKACPGFQAKAPPLAKRLAETGLVFDRDDVPHGIVTTLILSGQTPDSAHSLSLPHLLAAAIGGHHGEWIGNRKANMSRASVGDVHWQTHQTTLIERMLAILEITDLSALENWDDPASAAFAAGITSIADWISSNEKYFPYHESVSDLSQYFQESRHRASEALDDLGWSSAPIDDVERSFSELFIFEANPVQRAIAQELDGERFPTLVIIEAPTGIGKTEAALYIADWLIGRMGLAGLYIAMPTQATSNQMFQRTGDFLTARYPNDAVNYQLAHSQAVTHPLYQEMQENTRGIGSESMLTAPLWFSHRKRTLLSPFGVGTVDQALLAILQVRHFFVRLFGLSGKVVIFDEVHAYDTYMSALFDNLLVWLRALGSPVVLLSATLPEEVRKRLLPSETVNADTLSTIPYPRATFVYSDNNVHTVALPRPADRTTRLIHIDSSMESLVEILQDALQDGGCAGVICNTVKDAQRTASALMASPYFSEDEVFVFHARFPLDWRAEIEQAVVELFGKQGERPRRAVVVATQVIEQSLDLDFDVLVSSIAPIDLLIQRIGRLHRHERTRPPRLNVPSLILRLPNVTHDVPDFESSAFVYEPYLLMRTWWMLRDHESLTLPQETSGLIETVYADHLADDPQWSDAMRKAFGVAYKTMRKHQSKDEFAANDPVIPLPDETWRLEKSFVEEPADDGMPSMVRTRLIAKSVQIVCLHRVDGLLSLDPEQIIPVDLDAHPTPDVIHQIMRHTLNVQSPQVLSGLEAIPLPTPWKRLARLKEMRPVIFEDSICHLPGSRHSLRLTRRFGLEILEED